MPKALKECLFALKLVPIRYSSIPKVIFPQICRIFQSYVYHIVKRYLPLFQQIADSLKKIGLVGTLIVIQYLLQVKNETFFTCVS